MRLEDTETLWVILYAVFIGLAMWLLSLIH